MSMTNQQWAPEALRHADGLESFARMLPAYGFDPQPLKDAAATVRSLHAIALELADQLSGKNERLAALVEAQQPAPSAAGAEPLHITHGPLMRHAAALLRSRKPTLPDHESVAAELEMAADGYPTPAGDPSPEWLEMARIAMEPTPPVESQPEPVGADRYAATLKAQNDQFEHALAELVDLVCPGLDSGNLLVDAKTAGDAAQVLRASRAQPSPTPQADSQPASVLPESLTLAVDRWFSENTGLGGCSDKDVSELAELFYGVAHAGGRESVDDALAIVESFGPGIGGLNDTYARQILLAEEVKRLRAARAPADSVTAPAGEVLESEDMRRARHIAVVAQRWIGDRTGLGALLYIGDLAWALKTLAAATTPPAQAADSVLEDAALLQEARTALWQPANVDLCERIDAYLDAARKQGANHE